MLWLVIHSILYYALSLPITVVIVMSDHKVCWLWLLYTEIEYDYR